MLNLEKYWWRLVSLASVGIILVFGNIDLSILPFNVQVYCQQNQVAVEQHCPIYNIVLFIFGSLKTYEAAITAIATIFIAYFTYTLRNATDNLFIATTTAADIAKDALITTERAFVFLEEFDIDFTVTWRSDQQMLARYTIKPRWRNNGTTPTRNMNILINWTGWWAIDLPNNFEYSYGTSPARMFLGPKATEWSAAIEIPPHVATEALKKSTYIFIWGRVDYEDIFDDTPPHFTRWCYRLNITNVNGDIQTQFVAFGDYNGSDEDSRQKRKGR